MGTLFSVLSFASLIAVFYFWLKKHNKKFAIISVIATIVFAGLFSTTSEYKSQLAKQETTHQQQKSKENKKPNEKKSNKMSVAKKKNTKKPSKESLLLSRAKKLKYGMSLDEVKKIMKDKPSQEEKDEVGNWTLMWGDDVVYLGFDENNKLNQAIEGAPQIAKQGKETAEKSRKNKNKKNKDKNNRLKGFAQYFGTKPSEEIQRMPSVYKTVQDGNNLLILWNPGDGLPLLLRVDDTVNNVTNVYIYNRKGNDPKGQHLYTGRTILQKNKRPNYYY